MRCSAEGNSSFRLTFSLQYGHMSFFPTMHQPRMQNSCRPRDTGPAPQAVSSRCPRECREEGSAAVQAQTHVEAVVAREGVCFLSVLLRLFEAAVANGARVRSQLLRRDAIARCERVRRYTSA